ncbi:ras-related protein Rab-10-like isoform X1 [Anneissia japonica]|uniref:ras-related protein Rab-10-like isoform X1 n=1 Tax=Anneissia japonica TaxID=1529436 RepID=UPI0014255546|nr:ras-related protein Rab-10-like isoform X1 [Anneissia japonica]
MMTAEGAPKKTDDFFFKLLLVGDGGVGKSSILLKFVGDVFDTRCVATLAVEVKIKTVELNGKEVKLQIWDTAGGEKFSGVSTSCFIRTAGIIMVYDMTNKKSFEHITSNWLQNVQDNTNEDVQKVLLANKCDLYDQRMVSKEKGESFAQENGMRFFESSAKTNINVETAILTLVEDIIEKNPTASLLPK